AGHREVSRLSRIQNERDGPVRRRLGFHQPAPSRLAGEIQSGVRSLTVDSEVPPPSFVAPPRTRSTTVQLSELSKQYRSQPAVDALSLTIAPGTILALLGPSGCGKTTCLRMIAGKRITRTPVHRRNIGMLFQNYALFPHMTVAENVAFGLEARRISRAEIAARVAGALQLVH